MEPEVRFRQIESLLHAMAERENQMEIRFNRRMDRAEQNMQKFDRRLEATRKLVEAGIKIVADLARTQKATQLELRQLAKSQQAFLDSLRKGGNGHGRLA